MSVNVIRARLNALRKNLPRDVNQSLVYDFNSMVQELEGDLQDSEISRFAISGAEVKPRIVSIVPGRGATYSKDKYCDNGVFKRQVEGLWAYLEETGVVEPERPESSPKVPPHSQTINIHGSVTASTIQQGDHNTATINYQNDVERVLEEIRPLLNAAKLTSEAKQELGAEFVTVEAQMKSPRPKHAIIRESLQSARHILEHAFGAGMAHAFFPLLVEFFKHH